MWPISTQETGRADPGSSPYKTVGKIGKLPTIKSEKGQATKLQGRDLPFFDGKI